MNSIFIKDPDDEPVNIIGIKYEDFNSIHQTDVSIVDGGIGHSFVTLNMTSQSGKMISSLISFYYTIVKPVAPIPLHNLENFFESSVDIDYDSDYL